MKKFAITDNDGLIVEVGMAVEVPDGAIELILTDEVDALYLQSMMVVDGAIIPRPLLDAIVVSESVYTLPAYPAGTLVEVFDISGNERIYRDEGEGAQVFSLNDAGVYEISITPPSPYMPDTMMVTIT